VGKELVLSKSVMRFGYELISIEKIQQHPKQLTDNQLTTQDSLLKTIIT